MATNNEEVAILAGDGGVPYQSIIVEHSEDENLQDENNDAFLLSSFKKKFRIVSAFAVFTLLGTVLFTGNTNGRALRRLGGTVYEKSSAYYSGSYKGAKEIGYVNGDTIYKKSSVYYSGSYKGAEEVGYVNGDTVYKKSSAYYSGSYKGAKEVGYVNGDTVYKKSSVYYSGSYKGAKEVGYVNGDSLYEKSSVYYSGSYKGAKEVGYATGMSKEQAGAALLLVILDDD